MTNPLPGIIVNPPVGVPVVVTITAQNNPSPTITSDPAGASPVTMPASLMAPMTFYVPAVGTWFVSVKAGSIELCGLNVTVQGPEVATAPVGPTPAQILELLLSSAQNIFPSGDATGATDTQALTSAIAAGGVVTLAAGKFYTNATITPTVPVIIVGQGAGADWNNPNDASWNPATQIIKAAGTGAVFSISGPVGQVYFDRFGIDCANLAVSGIIADRWQGGGVGVLGIRRSTGYAVDLVNNSSMSAIDNMGLTFGTLYLRGGGLIRLSGASGTPAIANTTHNTFGRIIGLISGQNDRTVTDASISGTTLTSTSQANFTQADVGLTVNSPGGTLSTVITQWISATQVTVALTGTVNATTVTLATAGIHFNDADNNDFHGVYLFREGTGLGFGVWFGHYARSNQFFHVESSAGVMATTPGVATYSNVLFGYDQDNNQPSPTLQTGANLAWTSDGQNSTGWNNIVAKYPTLESNNAGTSKTAIKIFDTNTGKQMYVRGLNASGGLAFLNTTFGAVVASLDNSGNISTIASVQPGNGTTSGPHVWGGSGAPNIAASVAGDTYGRTDTPGTAGQRQYIATAANTWTALSV